MILISTFTRPFLFQIKSFFYVLFISLSSITIAAQTVSIKGTAINSPDPYISITTPVDGKFFSGAVTQIKLDTATGNYMYRMRLSKAGFVIVRNNWNEVKLFVEPNKSYTCNFLFKDSNTVETQIDGFCKEANRLLNHSDIVKDARVLAEPLDQYTTVAAKHHFLDSTNATALKPFFEMYKKHQISKSFLDAVRNELSVSKSAALGTDYFFLFRSTGDGRDSAKYQNFKQIFFEDWKSLYKNINDSLQWLNSTMYGSTLNRYLGFKEVEKTGTLAFDDEYISRIFKELKSSLKGSMLEYAWAYNMQSIYEQNNFDKELMDAYRFFKKKFSYSKLLPWLKKINDNVFAYYENQRKNNPAIQFIDASGINQAEQLFDTLKSDKVSYVDMWATWCLPCRMELKYAVPLHPEFEKIGINTVYLSFDRAEDKDKWMAMSKSLGLEGRNLLATKNLQKQLYDLLPNFTGIPRYIILSPEGKLLNADAKRPTDQLELLKQLKEYADKYNKK